MPPSRPVSPPTLLPPLELHSTGFGDAAQEPAAAKAKPVDETPVEVDDEVQAADMPAVAVVPPTPTASGLSKEGSEATEEVKA